MLIIDIGILLVYFINSSCGTKTEDMYDYFLVKSLSKGQVEIQVPLDNTKLEELNNPYDAVERGELERDTDYVWDAAYYNQKYYVYFGVLPALLLMVPYHLITKKLMNTFTATMIFSILSVPFLVLITKKVFEKYFKETPFKYMALSSVMMMLGTMLILINVAPRFYELVTVAGLFFALFGFYLVFDCEREDKISYKKMFLGCLSLSLAVACRPTQLFASLLIAPILLRIFIKNIKEKKNIKDIEKNLCAVIIPYIAVGYLVMRYNYLRFGNVFEFGEKYQLTINNMKELRLRLITIPTGILCHLFGLPTFQATFPFIHLNADIIDTFAYYYVEDMPGGVFFLAPIAFFCFAIFKLWKKIENKEMKTLVTSLLTVGLIFVCFISLKAGSTGRYLLDFAWLFVLAGIILFMEIFKSLKTDEGKKILEKVFGFIVIYTVIINLLIGFCVVGGVNSMRENSPDRFLKAEYTVMFLK